MITTKQIKRDIVEALNDIGHKATPKLVGQVYHNYMSDSGDSELDTEDAIRATLGDDAIPY